MLQRKNNLKKDSLMKDILINFSPLSVQKEFFWPIVVTWNGDPFRTDILEKCSFFKSFFNDIVVWFSFLWD